ncbi:hypothetical protein FQR65_LT10388 [Abscondita terminalis]|nr:hypothetical protein FQR65_LT10388 [Abscondita terminalis]
MKIGYVVSVTLVAVIINCNAIIPDDVLKIWTSDITKHISTCICATGADEAIVMKYIFQSIYIDDPCFKCYLKCTLGNNDLFNSDGSIPVENWIKVAGVNATIVGKCVNLVQDRKDLCQKAFEYSRCIRRTVSGDSSLLPKI